MTTQDEHPEIPRLGLRPEEAAMAIGISKSKFDELLADRTSGLPVIRVGRRVVVHARLLDAWLEDHVGKKV